MQLIDIIRDIIKNDPQIKAILTPTLTINPAKIEQIVNKVLDEQVQLLDVLDSGDVLKSTIRERLHLGAIPDVEQEINNKEDGLGNPTVEQRFLTSTPEGFRSWDKPIPLWGTIQGEMSAQNDLTVEFLKHFKKDEYIDVSEGGADHGKPVVLNAQGKLDPTMVVGVDFNPQGEFTPTAGAEYPTAQDPFEVWRIGGLSQGGYLYTTGNLAGRVGHNDNILLYLGAGQWSLLQFSGDTSTFYVLDGSRAITQPFNAGNQRLSHVTDGTEDSDGATVRQVNTVATALDDKYDKTGGDINGEVRVKDNNLLLYRGIYQWVLAHTTSATSTFEIRSGSTPKLTINLSSSVLALQAGRLVYNNKDMASEEFVTDGLGEKADTTALTSHLNNHSNPHDVTKGQVGLDYVDNTSDKNKPVSDATQDALDLKADLNGADFKNLSIGGESLSPYSNRNKFINGGFDVWERGVTFNLDINHTYTADRWSVLGNGVSVTEDKADELIVGNAIRISPLPGNIKQGIELKSRNEFGVGRVFTLSALIWVDVETDFTYDIWFRNASNTVSDEVEVVPVTYFGTVPSGTWKRITATFTINATPHVNNTQMLVIVRPSSGGANIVKFAEMQFEEGSVATPFEERPISYERMLCQRYFQRSYSSSAYRYTDSANSYQSGIECVGLAPMRIDQVVTDLSDITYNTCTLTEETKRLTLGQYQVRVTPTAMGIYRAYGNITFDAEL